MNGWLDNNTASGQKKTESDQNSASAEAAAENDSEIRFLPLMPLDSETDSQDKTKPGPEIRTKTKPTDDPETGADMGAHVPPQNNGIQSRFDKSLEFYQASQDYWQQGELENALDALDKAYAMINNTQTDDAPKFSQQKDDLRYMISKRILEIYTSRYTTVKGNHNAIQLVMNEHVKDEIKRYTTGPARRFFINSYRRSGRYRPYIVKKLEEAGIPEELSWLPLVESGFKTKALSSARALGMWQFIASTGYKFGLKRDRYIDERLDPYKSTQAAIDYLKELHEIFGDWKTALAAYNCGAGRVLHVIRSQNINYLDDFWDLYQQLPLETARYVPKFLATLHIVNNMEKYGMGDVQVDPPIEFETVNIEKQASLKDIAKAIDTTEEKLTALNPELRYKVLPDETYKLNVPPEKKETLLAKIDQIEEYYQSPNNITHHRVRPGETLSTIARRYNTTVKKICWYNNIYRKDYIVAGQRLKIPQAGTYASRGKAGEPDRVINYRVKRGDSLWVLAKRYNTTTRKIQKINNLNSVNLHIGQKLKIPAGERADLDIYRVKKGDSPYTIAKRHNMNLNQLLRINQLSKNARIYPGQTLYVE
ncbi:MAG: LysM peptidoglycan-binding domain-containing protein [Desulfobacteraceae bacterium]|nr:LysM peptidoglycan-binding domain-containing protein [Desulfobacteraceae bacterium]